MKKIITTQGVVAEYDGKYWGVQYDDGHCTNHDFGPIENATISNPQFCKHPTDMTYKGSYDTGKLERARLVPVTMTKTWEVADSATNGLGSHDAS